MNIVAALLAGCVTGLVHWLAFGRRGAVWITLVVGVVGGLFGGTVLGPIVRFGAKLPPIAMGDVGLFDIGAGIATAAIMLAYTARASR